MKDFARVVFNWAFGNWLWSVMPLALGILSAGIVGKKAQAPDFWTWTLAIGAALTVTCIAAVVIRVTSKQYPWLAEAINTTPADGKRASQLQKTNLVGAEIAVGRLVVERAIGTTEVHEVVDDTNWVAHRNQVAATDEAVDAFPLATVAWDGFARYNKAVTSRSKITDPQLVEIAAQAKRAADALAVAASKLARG